jgi:hypothetical protein
MEASKKKFPLVLWAVLRLAYGVLPSTAAFSADISLDRSAAMGINSPTAQSAMRVRCHFDQGVAVGTHSEQASRRNATTYQELAAGIAAHIPQTRNSTVTREQNAYLGERISVSARLRSSR